MEDLQFDSHLSSATQQQHPASADMHHAAAAGWCVRCPKHRKKFCGGLYYSVSSGHAYVKGSARLHTPAA